jgi:hypothetical protein
MSPRFRRDSFMQPTMTDRQLVYEVDTTHGIFFVPADVFNFSDDPEALAKELHNFVEGEVENVQRRYGYLARMSAPGYMDCTDWIFGTNKRELMRELREMYGDD